MAHHAYFFTGDQEQGIEKALSYGRDELGLAAVNNPNVVVFRYGLFSVDDARRVIRIANQSPVGSENKLVVIAVDRIFHEAQNALLKLFEEPPTGTTLILIVPSAGILLGTLKSRMVLLGKEMVVVNEAAQTFLAASVSEREKLVSKLLDRAKSDKDDEKQAARGEALKLAEGLAAAAYASYQTKASEDTRLFMHDLDRCIPILHERSAPLKLIFEHILLTTPESLG